MSVAIRSERRTPDPRFPSVTRTANVMLKELTLVNRGAETVRVPILSESLALLILFTTVIAEIKA